MGPLRLLLDTHCWLWTQADPDRLPSPLRRRLRTPQNLVLSAVCILEIALKHARGKLEVKDDPAAFIQEIVDAGVAELPITRSHSLRSAALPRFHPDPFDRLLVAQAQLEGLMLVTADPNILKYDVTAIDARK